MRENLKVEKWKNEAIVYFECQKCGYIRSECPLLNKLKKKAMVATCDDNNEESSDEEDSQEVSNLTLMAIWDDELDEINDLSTYDKLYDALKELYDELMKVSKMNACLKKKTVEITNENESLSAKISYLELENKTLHDRFALSNEKASTSHEHIESHVDDLKKENEMLKKRNIELSDVILKFTSGQKMMDNLLNSYKCVFNKGGIGYKTNLKQKYYKNKFVKSTSINNQVVYHHCNQDGHMKNRCPVKRNAYYGIKCIWVPKGIIANTQWPKSIWLPKGITWFVFCRYIGYKY